MSSPIDFCPSVYEHAARLIDKSPWAVSRDPKLLSRAHVRAFEIYRHSPVVLGIDIYNLEAEAYGAVVKRPVGNGIPAIGGSTCQSLDDLLQIHPLDPKRDGRIPMVIEAGKETARRLPEADVRIPVSGPFSIAGNILGCQELLYDVAMRPRLVRDALHHLVTGQIRFCEEIVANGLDIAFFESAAAPPLLSPADFDRIELDPLTEIIRRAACVVGHPVPCVIGGDTLPILDAMLKTQTGYVICPFETDQPNFMKAMAAFRHVTVRINMDLRLLTCDDFEVITQEVDRVLELAGDRENVCLGTGALPYETTPETILRIHDYLLERFRSGT